MAGFSITYVALLQTTVTAFLFAIGLLPCYLPLVVYEPRGLQRAKNMSLRVGSMSLSIETVDHQFCANRHGRFSQLPIANC
jgi:hypothetical protein